MILLSDSSMVYVACPGNTATGGPELLHQLCKELIAQGFRSVMYYYQWKDESNPVHAEYAKYQCPWETRIAPTKEDLVIVPETDTWVAKKMTKSRVAIWWLSVDNYFVTLKKPLIDRLSDIKNGKTPIRGMRAIRNKGYLHLAQSRYAVDFLSREGIESLYLSDYLNQDIVSAADGVTTTIKEDLVAYNPKKGIEFTKRIIGMGQDTRFAPIEKMKRAEVIELLKRCKVYIDFGEHPGKDRIPREAAMLGCCVITGKKGSAANGVDVGIPDRFKFSGDTSEAPAILALIRSCFSEYSKLRLEFDAYRAKIRSEAESFKDDVALCFRKKGASA